MQLQLLLLVIQLRVESRCTIRAALLPSSLTPYDLLTKRKRERE